MTGATGRTGATGMTGLGVTGPTGFTGANGEIRYRIPDPMGEPMWCMLGTWATSISDNRICTLRISSQSYSVGVQTFRTAFLHLSSGNWNNVQQAIDGSTFYAWAELQNTSSWPNATADFFIEQVGQPTSSTDLSFRVYV